MDDGSLLSEDKEAAVMPFVLALKPHRRDVLLALLRVQGPAWKDLRDLADTLSLSYAGLAHVRRFALRDLETTMPSDLHELVCAATDPKTVGAVRRKRRPRAPAIRERAASDLPVLVTAADPVDLAGWLDCLSSWDRDLFCMLLGLDGWHRHDANEAARALHERTLRLMMRVRTVMDALDSAGMPTAIRLDIWDRLHAPFP